MSITILNPEHLNTLKHLNTLNMAAYSWPLTPLLCQPSIAMGPPVAAPLRLTALSLPKRADAKSALILNWSAPGGAPGLWSLPVRLLDVGQTRLADSSVCSRKLRPVVNRVC